VSHTPHRNLFAVIAGDPVGAYDFSTLTIKYGLLP